MRQTRLASCFGGSKKRRKFSLQRHALVLEPLEDRCLLSVTVTPTYHVIPSGNTTNYSAPPLGAFTPAQIKQAYGIDQIRDGGTLQNGAGMTIAIIDFYDDPMIVSRNSNANVNQDPAFLASDLHKFDVQFGLPEPAGFFTKVDQNGGTNYPPADTPNPVNGSWATEIAMDVEWLHATAPGAKIVLVEAPEGSDFSPTFSWVRDDSGAVAVSMSWGISWSNGVSTVGENSSELAYDAALYSPASHGITYLAATGDGYQGANFPTYPAFSSDVVAVGGTTLTAPGGVYGSEVGWNDGFGDMGCGGVSVYESQPSYQQGLVIHSGSGVVNQSGKRAIPDVSLNAGAGVAVYDSYDFGTSSPWAPIGGTSLSCPIWAGLVGIADEIRANHGLNSLDGASQTLPTLYSIYNNPTQYANDFHDITSGSNSYSAATGYDLVTGIGSPKANTLVPDLAGVATAALQVSSSTPANGVMVATRPSSYVITFSAAIDPTSLQASDLTVNSIPASQVTLSTDGLTATFTYNTTPITTPGLQTMAMAAGAVTESGASTSGNQAFSSTFQYLFTLAQIKHAYGIDQITDGGTVQDGTGITIAIIDPYDNPHIVSQSDPNFLASDLHQFDLEYGLPEPAGFFTKVDQNGGTNYPGLDPVGGWETETALDVEWVHAIAPGAKIILVEADNTDEINYLGAAAVWARNSSAAQVVSMSYCNWESADETSYDAIFHSPANRGITWVAASGDWNSPSYYPAYSPDVVSVGGTSLYTSDTAGDYSSETGWDANGYSSSGGISQYESQPSYQQGLVIHSGSQVINQNGMRAVPDVSFDADPNTGPAMYDSFGNPSAPWTYAAGTSLACPVWAGLIGIADEMRKNHGLGSLDSGTQTLPKLYSIYNTPSEYANDFHDITSGSNGGYSAATGYDLVTGLGSPQANNLIPDLANLTVAPTVTAISPMCGSALGGTTVTITGTNLAGATAVKFGSIAATIQSDTATQIVVLSPAAPAGTVDVTVTTAAGTSATSSADRFTYQVQPSNLVVTTLVDKLSGTYDPANLSLREALGLANASPTADTISFAPSLDGGTINLSLGELAIANSVTVIGPGAANLTINGNNQSRIFDVNDGNDAVNINVEIDGLTLTGGKADTGGAIYSKENLSLDFVAITGNTTFDSGGGIDVNVDNKGRLAIQNSTISGNSAGVSGGGIDTYFQFGGTATVQNSTISGNISGYLGGGIWTRVQYNGTATIQNSTIAGNSAHVGGGIFVEEGPDGTTNIQSCTIAGNSATYGGGIGITGTTNIQNCTIAGNSAADRGGGLWMSEWDSGTTIENSTITGNIADNGSNANGGGGGIYAGVGITVTAASTIIAGNSDPSHTGPDVVGPITLSHSLIGDATGSGLTEASVGSPDANGNLIGGPIHGVLDPKLGPLANNGGPTQTCALLAGSPAIDRGSNPAGLAYDQRGTGYPRVLGAQADMGAYESTASATVPTVTTISPTSGSTAGGTTVTITGAGFTGATEVDFGGVQATGFVVDTATQITATSPAGTGTVDVTVTTAAGTSTTSSADRFTYQAPSGNLVVTTLVDKLDTNYDPANLSLREAIALANAAPSWAEITFAPNLDGGTIHLTLGELAITHDTTIQGLGSSITIDAGGNSRIFDVDDSNPINDITVNIDGLTLTGGSANEGGAIYSTEYLALAFVNFMGNTASDKGGGLYAVSTGETSLQQCVVSGNTAGSQGGGIYAATATEFLLQECTISGNTAGGNGGGIYAHLYVDPTSYGGQTVLQNCNISNNSAASGGGLFSTGSGQTVIQESTISGNSATGNGGGLDISTAEGLILQGSTISGNFAAGNIVSSGLRGGGGILLMAGGATYIQESTLSGNHSVAGGGIAALTGYGSSMTIQGSTISGNSSQEGGGLLVINYSYGATTVQDSTIAGNSAGTTGGGIAAIDAGGTTTIQNSTITGNSRRLQRSRRGRRRLLVRHWRNVYGRQFDHRRQYRSQPFRARCVWPDHFGPQPDRRQHRLRTDRSPGRHARRQWQPHRRSDLWRYQSQTRAAGRQRRANPDLRWWSAARPSMPAPIRPAWPTISAARVILAFWCPGRHGGF